MDFQGRIEVECIDDACSRERDEKCPCYFLLCTFDKAYLLLDKARPAREVYPNLKEDTYLDTYLSTYGQIELSRQEAWNLAKDLLRAIQKFDQDHK